MRNEQLSRMFNVVILVKKFGCSRNKARTRLTGHSIGRSQVKYLNPVVNDNDVLHIGGRIGKSSMECHARFPINLPSKDVAVE